MLNEDKVKDLCKEYLEHVVLESKCHSLEEVIDVMMIMIATTLCGLSTVLERESILVNIENILAQFKEADLDNISAEVIEIPKARKDN